VAVTGDGDAESERRSRQAGFQRHVRKPAELTVVRRPLAGLERAALPGPAADAGRGSTTSPRRVSSPLEHNSVRIELSPWTHALFVGSVPACLRQAAAATGEAPRSVYDLGMTIHPVLIAGEWRPGQGRRSFGSENPATGERLSGEYPISEWADCDAALDAAAAAAAALRTSPPDAVGAFLDSYAARIEARKTELVEMANAETGLAKAPRLGEVELPRTANQLRQAAAAAREGSWALPTIDTRLNIRSVFAPIGPVWVFGPNNFPFAFNSVAGGDFAAAIAAGNPVIAKANSSHPGTTRLFAEEAHLAAREAGLPPGAVQLIYRTSHEDGERLVADPRTGAVGYTGSRSAGLKLKAAADAAGKPIYLELSAVNPVLMLPGALAERGTALVDEFVTSSLMGTGQFCTNPSLVLLLAGEATEQFVAGVRGRFDGAAPTPLLSSGVARTLGESVSTLQAAGASLVTGGAVADGTGYRFCNTLLRVSGNTFLRAPAKLQTEAFGNAALFVVAKDAEELAALVDTLEGSLTGCFYTDTKGADDALYAVLEPLLRQRVGRLLNDKMPTGVAVTPAMNHGGPYPSTGHPGFTAVGIPAALRRFGMLQCYDNVRHVRLPALLRDQPPNDRVFRLIDGEWRRGPVSPA
jgi:alpha-ketoglutaric semialdehyde dehydrogenase